MGHGIVVALAIAGIILLALEFFVIPGFGISGILGISSLVTAIILVSGSLLEGIIYTAATIIVIGVLLYLSFRSPETNKLWKMLSLSVRQTKREGYVAPDLKHNQYLGRDGTALTPLRPSGTADFSGERLDVVTEGDFIKKGSLVKVVAVEVNRIIVREDLQRVLSVDN